MGQSTSGELSEDELRAMFRRDAAIIGEWMAEENGATRWVVERGSPLTRDDELTAGPDPLSHQAISLIHASLDHLHGVRVDTIHTHAQYAMIRAGIETAATAWWLMAPEARRGRTVRSVRLYWQDSVDAISAFSDLGSERDVKAEQTEKRQKLEYQVGATSHEVCQRVRPTDVLEHDSRPACWSLTIADTGAEASPRMRSTVTFESLGELGDPADTSLDSRPGCRVPIPDDRRARSRARPPPLGRWGPGVPCGIQPMGGRCLPQEDRDDSQREVTLAVLLSPQGGLPLPKWGAPRGRP